MLIVKGLFFYTPGSLNVIIWLQQKLFNLQESVLGGFFWIGLLDH